MSLTRKILLIILVTLVLVYILARLIAPQLIDKQYNTLVHAAPYQVSNEAQQLYDSLEFVADLHSDVLLWDRDILKLNNYGHEDIPRMLEANLALQAFTIVNKVPSGLNFKRNSASSDQLTLPFILQGRPISSWFDLTERVLDQSQNLHQFSQKSGGKFTVITSKMSLKSYLAKRKTNKQLTAGFLGIEGAQALQGSLENIDIVYKAGVRMIGLTHFFDNELGGSAHGVAQQGLTSFGRKAVKAMEKKNILIDLSHASPQMVDDVLDIAQNPVIVSHTGVKGTCNNVRNLSDNHLKRIADNGGLVGIAMFKQTVCGTEPRDIAKAIIYTRNLVGVEHVALGSDFDGAVKSIIEVRGLPTIVEALLAQGMPEQEIRQVMGDNVRNFLLTNLPN